jgi:amino acid transporter
MHFSKYGIGQNNVLSLIKFFPLGFGVIAGFIIFITMRHGEVANNIISSSLPHPQDNVPFSLDGVSPFLGIIASIPAIFFVFDGFYTAGSLLNEMEKPEKFSSAITIGVLCIAGAYAIFSISLLISSVGGSFFGLTDAMNKNKFTKVLSFIVLFCIALSCFGTINS